jgi:hypothetical protein
MPCKSSAAAGASGDASRLDHPLNAGVHFFLFDEFTSCNLGKRLVNRPSAGEQQSGILEGWQKTDGSIGAN